MNPLSAAYGRATRLRRAWYARGGRARRLGRPVISVGNLVVGGSGKTPLVAALARLLAAAGERPAILSRGYGRRERSDSVVVVSDTEHVLATPTRSGDEPYMLASSLPGIPVLSSPDRFVAGRLAEQQFGCTVHLLDDGFQHVQLARDVNLLVMSASDLDETLLPFGRLREPLTAGQAADAVLVAGKDDEVRAVLDRLGVATAFRVVTRYQTPRVIASATDLPASMGRNVIAVAGIARPLRFFAALRSLGWDVAREMTFRDHHWFTERDVADIEASCIAAGADVVITTEKDAVRLAAIVRRALVGRTLSGSPGEPNKARATAIEWAFLPLELDIEPRDLFAPWLIQRLAEARRGMEAA